MDWQIIFAAYDSTWLGWGVNVLKVVVGLGMVIFVHELGHFLVAKMCGVKCEKFYLGFDFFGLKLWKMQWGETEYGIGVFPLGGYVKMLGQEDNPARLREEFERAKAAQEAEAGESSPTASEQAQAEENAQTPTAGTETAETQVAEAASDKSDAPALGEEQEKVDLEAVRAALYDPRSYLSKSVPARMAIISAGVIMNVIFAFVVAAAGFGLGVRDVRCGVGEVVPGKPAWVNNVRSGDDIRRIAGEEVERFQELRTGISLGDLSDGVEMVIDRPGDSEPFRVRIMPDQTGPYPTIGVGLPFINALGDQMPALPGTAGAEAEPPLKPGDRFVQVGGVEVEDYASVRRQFALRPAEPITVVVERKPRQQEDGRADAEPALPERVTITIAPQPVERLGLIMKPGPIVAVQKDSPAERAGLVPGDHIEKIDGEALGDPLTLAERLRQRAGERISISVRREGESITFSDVELRRADWFDDSFVKDSPVGVPALGIALEVENRVAGVIDDSLAAAAGVSPGSVVTEARLLPPDKMTIEQEGLERAKALLEQDEISVAFDDEEQNWPYLISLLQSLLPGTTVELTLRDADEEEQTVTLSPEPIGRSYEPMRGLLFQRDLFTRQAHSLSQAVSMGYEETIESLLLIWKMLEKLGTGQVSAGELRGPLGIIQAASQSAAAGTGELLMFLCILSANLAVLNFLPIPVLDGGHMVFLAYEGITGKPPSEGVFVTLSYLGLIFILGLMIWAIGLDVGRLVGGS